eukprot:7134274-Prymnesium_polylepis.3
MQIAGTQSSESPSFDAPEAPPPPAPQMQVHPRVTDREEPHVVGKGQVRHRHAACREAGRHERTPDVLAP